MLGTRLEKLEKDLQLLSVMQNLLVSKGSSGGDNEKDVGIAGIVRKLFEPPERDTSMKIKNGERNANRKIIRVTPGTISHTNVINAVAHLNYPNNPAGPEDIYEGTESAENPLSQELRFEKERRNEVEEAGRRVAIKLQQTEDEFEREKESKKVLLVGTLHLKNQLQGYENRINQLEIEIGNEKTGRFKLLQEIELVNNEKVDLKRQIDSCKNEIQQEKSILQNESHALKIELKETHQKLEQNKQVSTQNENAASENEQKLRNQMTQLLNKCVQIDKEKERLQLELHRTIKNAQNTEEELTHIRRKLIKLENDNNRESVLHECILNKTKSDITEQNRQVEERIQAAHFLLTKTKQMLILLRQERDSFQSALRNSEEQNKKYKGELEILKNKAHNFEHNEIEARERVHILMSEKLEKDFGFEKEITSLKQELKKLKIERRENMRFLKEVKAKFVEEKNRLEESGKTSEEERNKLKVDLSRLKDNFQILQKISQDQTSTIQKLKSDLSEIKEAKFHLQSQLNEKDHSEITLTEQLEEEIREVRILEDQVAYLECKLTAMEDDLKSHSCEDFVESTCKNKLVKLESTLKSRYAEWQRSIESLKSERNEAVAAARKAKRLAEETQADCETNISEAISINRLDTAKFQAENQRLLSDKSARIYELESELERVRLESSQSQRSLMGKIQQLQLALNICLGGVTAPINPNPPAAAAMSGSLFGLGIELGVNTNSAAGRFS